ncbi:MAG: hypothetical protein MUC60_04185 [Oscillatoria sp. Prado101]|nr:hypothetical protein [Oscillatoria sp. Prado101]
MQLNRRPACTKNRNLRRDARTGSQNMPVSTGTPAACRHAGAKNGEALDTRNRVSFGKQRETKGES